MPCARHFGLRARRGAWYIGAQMPARRFFRSTACVLLALLLQACVVVPRTTEQFDPGCRAVVRRMTLEAVQVAALGGCANGGCVALLAAAGATAAASAVVSGSIAVVGNVVYWLERQGRCAAGAS